MNRYANHIASLDTALDWKKTAKTMIKEAVEGYNETLHDETFAQRFEYDSDGNAYHLGDYI